MENLGPSSSNYKIDRIFPWKKAWQTLKAIWPQLVYISLVCMSIPQYLLFCISSQKAFKLSQAFKVNQSISFENSLGVLQDFVFHYLSVGWIVCVLFLLGSFTAVALCIQTAQSEPISVNVAFKSSLRSLFPKGLAFLFFVLIGGLLSLNIAVQIFPGQFIRFLGLIFVVLLTALPALMLLDRNRPLMAFRRAISLDYAAATGMSKWSVFFLLLTYILVAMNAVALLEWLSLTLSQIDTVLGLKREVIFQSSAALPIGKIGYISEALFSLIFGLLVMGFLVLNSSFVYELHRRNSLGRTIDTLA